MKYEFCVYLNKFQNSKNGMKNHQKKKSLKATAQNEKEI